MNNFCECNADGHCNRYNKFMGGRLREICAGINCDLGTSAAFREQLLREANMEHAQQYKSYTPLLLKMHQAPGDAVAMTAAIHSLHKAYPNKFLTSVESYWPDVFANNPNVFRHVVPNGNDGCANVRARINNTNTNTNTNTKDLDLDLVTSDISSSNSSMLEVQMHYPAIHYSNIRSIHFMQGWCEFLGKSLGIEIPLLTNKPDLYLTSSEVSRSRSLVPVKDYWLICSGGKFDFTNKMWGQERYQEVVDLLVNKINFIQVGGSKPIIPWNYTTKGSQEDNHKKLNNVVDLLGKTSLRELFALAHGARGILCGVSLLMHVCAAFKKPGIIIAGGREPVAWNAYPIQQYLHNVGMLGCRDNLGNTGGACWRNRTVALNDGLPMLDENLCEYPVNGIPKCMTMIDPKYVAQLISDYDSNLKSV